MQFEKLQAWKLISGELLVILAGVLFLATDYASLLLADLRNPSVMFGLGGVASAVTITNSDKSSALILQADNKLVRVASGGFGLARYNPDGSLDASFGTGGKVTTRIGTDPEIGEVAHALALQADGKIVVVGRAWRWHSDDFALARYNSDGSLDASFGTDGIVTTDFTSAGSIFPLESSGGRPTEGRRGGMRSDTASPRSLGPTSEEAFALALQEDGKPVAAGAGTGFTLARYDPNGSLDVSFGEAGKRSIQFETRGGVAHALALQRDGKIVTAGASGDRFALVRCNPDGSVDTSFGTEGRVITPIGTRLAEAYTLVIQKDRKIVVAGIAYDDGAFGFALVRYNLDGSVDNSFGAGGTVVTAVGMRSDETHPFGPQYTYNCRLCDMALQLDDKIVVVGASLESGKFDFALVRYHPDGSLDAGFGTAGKVTTAVSSGNDYASALAIQPDGKIVVAGDSDEGKYTLVRYNPDGSLDPTFGTQGKVITQVSTNTNAIEE